MFYFLTADIFTEINVVKSIHIIFLSRSFSVAVFLNKFDDDLIKSVCISPVRLRVFSNLSSNLKRILVYN